MRNGKSAIPDGMHARDFIAEVCVPALIDAAVDRNAESVTFIRGLINETLEEALPDQKPLEAPRLCTCGRKDFCTSWCGE